MADWDADDFEPDTPAATGTVPKVTDKWDGEDEDEDCKVVAGRANGRSIIALASQAAWDDSSEEEKEEDESKPVKVKKKKTLAQKIAEKEAAAEQARLEEEAEAEEDTPEAKLAAKMKMQRLAEEEDRELFKDLVGGVESGGGGQAGVIDGMVPETKAEFETFGKLVADKFSSLEGSDHFQDFAANFIESLCRDQLNVATLKKVKQHAEAFISAKLKEEKNKGKAAAKKPEKKATLKMGRGDDHMSMAGGGFDDMDDFM
jgi:translation initiation factor 3 subunit J